MPGSGSAASGGRITLELDPSRRGQRLDRALADLLPDHSRSALQRLLREGRVSLAGKVARPSYRVRGGEWVLIDFPVPAPTSLMPEDRPLVVLYEDADLIVLDKPAGLTVHPGAGLRSGTLVNALLHHCRGLSTIGGVERPGIVHRLDRDTTGVLVVAKNDLAHRSLAAQFKARTVKKLYEALVWGRPSPAEGMIDAPVGRHPTARIKMALRPDGRPARSAYRVASTLGPVSLVEVLPQSGRTHQIRVHLASIGHPVVGDRLYGGDRGAVVRDRRLRSATLAYHGLALHARSIGFTHPRSGEWREFVAPPPADFQAFLEELRHAALHVEGDTAP